MSIICTAILMVGFTYPLTDHDKRAIKQAPKTCAKLYPDAPCLKKLIKKEDGVYNAICGEAKSNTK